MMSQKLTNAKLPHLLLVHQMDEAIAYLAFKILYSIWGNYVFVSFLGHPSRGQNRVRGSDLVLISFPGKLPIQFQYNQSITETEICLFLPTADEIQTANI